MYGREATTLMAITANFLSDEAGRVKRCQEFLPQVRRCFRPLDEIGESELTHPLQLLIVDLLPGYSRRHEAALQAITGMDLGNRCNQEWQWRLAKVKQEHGITGTMPYGRTRSCAILPITQGEMLAAITIGQILAVLLTLNLIVLSFAAYRIMRRK